jgi:hypothetical protein
VRKLLTPFNVITLLLLAAAAWAYSVVGRDEPLPEVPTYGAGAERRTVQATLYFSDPQLAGYQTEKRAVTVERDSVAAVAQAALGALAEGPTSGGLRVLPKNEAVPSVWVRNDHFFVDLPESYTRLNYGASGEQMVVCTIVQTLLDLRGARDVSFLLGGRNAETLLGHFDLGAAYTKDDCKL